MKTVTFYPTVSYLFHRSPISLRNKVYKRYAGKSAKNYFKKNIKMLKIEGELRNERLRIYRLILLPSDLFKVSLVKVTISAQKITYEILTGFKIFLTIILVVYCVVAICLLNVIVFENGFGIGL